MSQPFEIGLSFTGTVSAGSYTGGVIDFILEALEEWGKAKQQNRTQHGEDYSKWNVPWHDVSITGLSGASGGGVTCGLILNAMGRNFAPVTKPATDTKPTGNDFYDAWVNMLGIEELLQTKDLNGDEISSLLNGNAIPHIADVLMQPQRYQDGYERKYFSQQLAAFITLTNLRGIPYEVAFNGQAANTIYYYRHTDYAKFIRAKIDPLPAADSSAAVATQELPEAKSVNTGGPKEGTNGLSAASQLPAIAQANQPVITEAEGRRDYFFLPVSHTDPAFTDSYQRLRAACLCTCAFPGGFKAQPFLQPVSFYVNRHPGRALAVAAMGAGTPITGPYGPEYQFMCADGGTLNTQPFQVLHDYMAGGSGKHNPATAETVERTLIMIAPLETGDKPEDKPNMKDRLITVLPEVLGALRQEAMFSAQEIALAYDNNVYSRFIIAPVRYSSATSDERMQPAITGSILGTFGAFLSRNFREHDYFLGRRNAQKFLQDHFTIPVSAIQNQTGEQNKQVNPVFGPVYKDAPLNNISRNVNGQPVIQIIPLCGSAKEPQYFPVWPKGKGYDLEKITEGVKTRLEKMAEMAGDEIKLGWIKKILLGWVAHFAEGAAVDAVTKKIQSELDSAKL